MPDNFKLRYFTISEIKSWLFLNEQNGLSSEIISKTRAYALTQNPEATDDDIALSVAWQGEELAGYTAIFYERFERPDFKMPYAWGTTLYVYPKFRGNNLGYRLMLHIKEACKYRYLGLESSDTSIKIDSKQGSGIYYFNRYAFSFYRHLKVNNIKSVFIHANGWRKNIIFWIGRKKILNNIKKEKYSFEYINFVDNELYSFIREHCSNDLFLRKQSVINWIIQHHFVIQTPLTDRIQNNYQFSSIARQFEMYPVKVFIDNCLVGFYILKLNDGVLTMMYLYYLSEYQSQVFLSVAEHILKLKPKVFRTFNENLKTFLHKKSFYSWFCVEKVSLTTPEGFQLNANLEIQGGDGDMLV